MVNGNKWNEAFIMVLFTFKAVLLKFSIFIKSYLFKFIFYNNWAVCLKYKTIVNGGTWLIWNVTEWIRRK